MFVLTEFERKPLLFEDPLDIISCSKISDMPSAFNEMERVLKSGHYLAGFLSYEAGYAFESRLHEKNDFDFPLLQMGVFNAPMRTDVEAKIPAGILSVRGINISESEYAENIGRIKDHISAGDVYQITYCIKFKFDYKGDPFTLYKHLKRAQPVPYPAYIETGDFRILSLSPEMFIKKTGDFVATKPMKGTWPRGRNFAEDLWCARRLHKDPKNRAENIMIADLLRNDLGRVGHSVKWPKLFEVARYTTLCQMTSTVTCRIDPDIPLLKVFSALHPSGSVTGTPKIRAMEIIRQIEREERKIYTGAIGFVTPQRDMFFNVPIRTLLINRGQGRGQGEMGVGGGIVWDSTVEGEWEEGMLKAKFLTELC